MKQLIPYGKGQLEITLDQPAPVLAPQRQAGDPVRQAGDPVRLALAAPVGSPPLHEWVKPGRSVVILTSDITRPCPTARLLPALMDELALAGVRNEDVMLVFALGSHRAHTPQEQASLVGPAMVSSLHYVDHDPSQVVQVGVTSRGTSIAAFKPLVEADYRIALGNVEPHYFAGYSGGAKALVPGVCSRATIQHNHAMMVHPQARSGVLNGNPIREDIEEGAAMIGLDFILNVIVDGDHQVTAAAAGHPVAAHRWLCRVLDYSSKVTLEQPADLVIVSSGGYPKDINLYQAQKALDNAAALVRPGGVILWLAECSEGLGNPVFESWILGVQPDEILARIQQDFVLGGHKAAAIARVLKRARVILVSALPPETGRACGMTPYTTFEDALHDALQELGPVPNLVILPQGGSVIPVVQKPERFSLV